MRCGAKCFLVQYEMDGENQTKSVIARSPVEARKFFRKDYGEEAEIIAVRVKKKRNGV